MLPPYNLLIFRCIIYILHPYSSTLVLRFLCYFCAVSSVLVHVVSLADQHYTLRQPQWSEVHRVRICPNDVPDLDKTDDIHRPDKPNPFNIHYPENPNDPN